MYDAAAGSLVGIASPDVCRANVLPKGSVRSRAPPMKAREFGEGCAHGSADEIETLDAQCSSGWVDTLVVLLFDVAISNGEMWITSMSPAMRAIVRGCGPESRMRGSVPLSAVFQPHPDGKLPRTIPCDGRPVSILSFDRKAPLPMIMSVAPDGRGIALPLDKRCREELKYTVVSHRTECEEMEAECVSEDEPDGEEEWVRGLADHVLRDEGLCVSATTRGISAGEMLSAAREFEQEVRGGPAFGSEIGLGRLLSRYPAIFVKKHDGKCRRWKVTQ